MRTNIVLDDDLLAQVSAIAGTTTKKATVEYALREVIRRQELHELADWRMDLNPDDVRPGIVRSKRGRLEQQTA